MVEGEIRIGDRMMWPKEFGYMQFSITDKNGPFDNSINKVSWYECTWGRHSTWCDEPVLRLMAIRDDIWEQIAPLKDDDGETEARLH